ncbi:efflux RND transporter periplasmic adaptor subunit [Paludisphaera rhizosphaerae]|uniref:efflux RND transporter periplasmic adaptor subunit n=1 Tax=Paludisphaera rhizosphaerae TaxID=2711216 RepID=UPI0013EB9726|nr:efflux RND transporter periplasmic adaptor subunit [Paludisphaera rhizosphaerae]
MSSADQPLTRWRKFRMVMKVVELRLRFVALMAATALTFAYWDTLGNYYEKWTRPTGPTIAATADHEFYCPMHPTVVQPTAGSCPICGMPLSKRVKGAETPLPAGVLSRLTLAPDRIAQAGVKTVAASYVPLTETVATVGTVEIDERRLRRIASRTKGLARVEKLHVDFTGVRVEAGQPLAEVYSPELYQAMQEMLLHQRTAQASPAGNRVLGDPQNLVRLAADKLKLWGITQEQIDRILKDGKADYRLPILSPIGGVVVRKGVVEGDYVAEGQALFEVADLSHIWVKAQVYENQFALVREGQAVHATVEAYPGEVFSGRVAFIDPVLNPQTRTAVVRYDLDNPNLRLKPGMFASVTLETPIADAPAFRERIARANAGAAKLHKAVLTAEEQEKCLVTDAKLGSMGDPLPVEVDGRKLWICCASCESKIKTTPARYLARLEAVPVDAVLAVPESAVIDAGSRKVVYIEAEPGVFEGREVVLGPISNSRYPVLEGLKPGDRVAASGAFLIDAETRLNPRAAGQPSTPAPRSAATNSTTRR